MSDSNAPKQYIVVRKDIKMEVGKIASQAAHAAMKIFFDRNRGDENTLIVELDEEMSEWIYGNFAKVILKCHSEAELLEIYKNAQLVDLPTSLIKDNGKTTFDNIPTNTCIAIGPCRPSSASSIVGHLKLL